MWLFARGDEFGGCRRIQAAGVAVWRFRNACSGAATRAPVLYTAPRLSKGRPPSGHLTVNWPFTDAAIHWQSTPAWHWTMHADVKTLLILAEGHEP
jgi:hypothetical protein